MFSLNLVKNIVILLCISIQMEMIKAVPNQYFGRDNLKQSEEERLEHFLSDDHFLPVWLRLKMKQCLTFYSSLEGFSILVWTFCQVKPQLMRVKTVGWGPKMKNCLIDK